MLDIKEERDTLKYITDNIEEKYNLPLDNVVVVQDDKLFGIALDINGTVKEFDLEKNGHQSIDDCDVLYHFKNSTTPMKFIKLV